MAWTILISMCKFKEEHFFPRERGDAGQIFLVIFGMLVNDGLGKINFL